MSPRRWGEPGRVGCVRAGCRSPSRGRARAASPAGAGCRGRWAAVAAAARHTQPPALCRQQQHPAPSPPPQAPAAGGNGVAGAGVGIGCRNRCPTCLLTPGHRFWCCPNSQRGFPVAGSGQGGWHGACQCLQQGVGHAQACASAERGRVLRVPPALPRWQLRGQDGDKWEFGVNSPGCQQRWSGA